MLAGGDPLGGTRRAIVDALKRRTLTAADLSEALDLTAEAVRQHLRALEERGLVMAQARRPSQGRGRPATEWRLTDLARELFPDRHADLTVDLIESIRQSVGEDGLERIIDDRNRRLTETYVCITQGAADPVESLAQRRSAEGYLAEVRDLEDGTRLLIEHHCPICEAASTCQGLCRGELELFRATLGDELEVTREQHLLSGDERCTYRIRPRSQSPT